MIAKDGVLKELQKAALGGGLAQLHDYMPGVMATAAAPGAMTYTSAQLMQG